ncbi:Methylcrotonoyl-CoA carboxylase beta chain, mitochondrial, partial [Operophtera brumata]
MQGITAGNVRQEFKRLLPLSIVDEVTCFVFYDNHPRDEKCIDITVCTKTGELREYFQRDLLSSITLNAASEPTEIIIMRNCKSELSYIVGNIDEVFIVSAKATLLIHTKITNVDKFSIDDPLCTGQASLRVIRKDDAVPIIFDENFKSSEVLFPVEASSDLLPLVTELKRKCIEAQYSVKNHEKSIE